MMGLTARQRDAFDFIRTWITSHGGVPPSYSEIGSGIGVSKVGVHRLLHCLQARGAIRFQKSIPRSIELIDGINVPLQPELREALSQYAKRTHAPSEGAAAAELLRQSLGLAA